MSDTIIRVENLGKKYLIKHQQQGNYTALRDVITDKVKSLGKKIISPWNRKQSSTYSTTEEFWALKDVSFEVNQGEVIGIIGRNGAGKTTLLKILSRITEPTTGRFRIKGRVASLLEVGTGFHPELTGRENVFLNGAILGMGKAEIKRKFDEIVTFAEIEKFLDTPVKRYSSGMYVRLAFAVAAYLEPEILLVDEVLAVGDAAFQKKCLGKMGDVAKEGRTVLFVSHNMGAIQQLTSRCILLSEGRLRCNSPTSESVGAYLGAPKGDINVHLQIKRQDVRIKSLRLNREVLKPGFNQPLTFDVEFSLDSAIRDVKIGMKIYNSIGVRILTSLTAIPEIPQVSSILSLVLKDHHLPPGEYSMAFGILIGGEQILHEERALSFTISDLDIADSFLVMHRDRLGTFLPCKYILR